MDCTARYVSYASTGYFSNIVLDYLAGDKQLRPFYAQPFSTEGIRKAIVEKQKHPVDRELLCSVLQKQYEGIALTEKQSLYLNALKEKNCFTVTTAHQPNIFTGHLYFVYKILHAIKLAEELSKTAMANTFVPVFYMGSEDADLEELGHIYLSGEKKEWKTTQKGAFGRMRTDKELLHIIDEISGQLLVHPYGEAIIGILKNCYREGVSMELANFKLVNTLFAEYGLLVLLPDNATLKKAFIPVIEKELSAGFSHIAVADTTAVLPATYKVQAVGRDINLFYLMDGSRERIERSDTGFSIANSHIIFSESEIKNELRDHPERFSPNVVLRPVLQEMLLPNIAFIGGGGEIAYWLELKKVFESVDVPFPLLVLRNSFLIVDTEMKGLSEKLHFETTDLFRPENELSNEWVKRESKRQLSLESEKQLMVELYEQVKQLSGNIDITLAGHTEALKIQALKRIDALEKKMLRSEKKRSEAGLRQLHKLKSRLFPNNSLQERVENILPFYAKWGKEIIELIYMHSVGLEQQFCILEEKLV